MKQKFVRMFSVMLSLLLCISLVACNKNKHEAKEEWKYDEENHWHECLTKDHDDKLNVEKHSFNDGIITIEPTEKTKGEKTYTCTVCNYQKKEEMNKLEHTHKFDTTKWKNDDKNHWHECSDDECESKIDEAAHSFDDGVVTIEPTEETTGEKTYTCSVCNYQKKEEMNKLEHNHKFDMENWESDESGHWHKATCEHTDEKNGYEEHKGDWTEKTPAGYGVEKVEERTCSVCGKHQERTVENSALAEKDNTITIGTIDFTYNAKSQPIDNLVSADNKAGMFIKYVGVDGTEYAESTTAPTNAGTYQYTITISATAEWKAAEKSDKYTINKYELTEVYKTTHTKEYDGDTKIIVRLKPFNVDNINVQIMMKSANAGTTEFWPIVINGPQNNNYMIDDSKVTAKITPKLLSGLNFAIAKSELIGTSGTQVITLTVPNTDGKVSVNISFDIITLTHENTLTLITDTPGQGEAQIEFSTEEGDEYKNYAFASSGIGTLTLTTFIIGG